MNDIVAATLADMARWQNQFAHELLARLERFVRRDGWNDCRASEVIEKLLEEFQLTPSPMIANIIGRCHVSESNLSVIRYLMSRLEKGWFRAQPRDKRRAILTKAIAAHRENRELFAHYRF